jgi:signal transduction histidine kinase
VSGVIGRAREIRQLSRTVRGRLALLYAGVFFGSGLVLLAIPAGFVGGGSSSRAEVTAAGGAPSPGGNGIARAQHSNDFHQLVLGSAIALVVLVVVSAGLGWVLAGRLLRPLRTITETAREISASNLNRRLELTGPDDEFKELGETLDELFERLEASFDSQRRFVANASHELRTPLTAERTLLQVALADPEADSRSLRTACEQVLTLGESQERLIDALLALASGERGLDHRQACDLAAIASVVLDERRPQAQARQLQVVSVLADARIAGDQQLVQSLIRNLIDNAIRHNLPGGRVEVTTRTHAGRAILSVLNTGPIIGGEQVGRLLQPFQRAGAERTSSSEGHGLGLTIAQAIVHAHGAQMNLVARPEGGLDVEVDFAAQPRP